MEIIESQFDVASDLGSDHLSDANASDDSGDEVCAYLTKNFLEYSCNIIMRELYILVDLY